MILFCFYTEWHILLACLVYGLSFKSVPNRLYAVFHKVVGISTFPNNSKFDRICFAHEAGNTYESGSVQKSYHAHTCLSSLPAAPYLESTRRGFNILWNSRFLGRNFLLSLFKTRTGSLMSEGRSGLRIGLTPTWILSNPSLLLQGSQMQAETIHVLCAKDLNFHMYLNLLK